ncbi:hypothetical protein DXG01_004631 [Tephrocybe rancida]|nr:hypothetical protein DXG01_004631 [Tephrocybe rancida]
MSLALPSPTANGRVSELVALITNAAKTIESHYSQSSSQPYVPSLDDVSPHPMDSAISPPALKDAVQILEGACAQLSATVARPGHTVLNTYEPTALNVVITFKIPDILQEKPSGMHIAEIGQKAGVDKGKLGRIMRLLASKNIFREGTHEALHVGAIMLQFTEATYDQSRWIVSLIPISTDEQTKTATAGLANYLADPEWGSAQVAERSPWNRSTGIQESMFQYFEGATPEGAKTGARFGIGMSGWNEATQAAAVLRDFPWGRFPPDTSVCDVGGGVGYVAMSLIKAYPNLQLKLQDLPDRIHQAETRVWPKEFPTAIDQKRIEFKAMDFFVDSPIEGCDVYYLKNIIHNWPDNECITILRNIRAVLKPSGRVLIRRILFHHTIEIGILKCCMCSLDDYILQHAHRTGDVSGPGFVEAPEPLLPNYGEGRIRQYNLDVCLMVLLNSRERTLEEFISMAAKADLEFVKLWDAGELGVAEFKSL